MSTSARVYVADTDPGVIHLVRGTLQSAGHTVHEAGDLDRMVEEILECDADVALIATGLRDHYYGDLLMELRRVEPMGRVSVITMIEADDRRSVGDSLAHGARDVIHKPLVPADVLNKVALHTGRAFPPVEERPYEDDPEDTLDGVRRLPLSELRTGSERYDRDLNTFIEVSEAIASSLEPDDVFFVLVRRLADAVPCDRCNVVLRGVGDVEAFVVASHEDPNCKRLPISLDRYPEYSLALESLEPVLIDDAQFHAVTEKVRSSVTLVQLGSIVVFPLIVRETAVGVLSISTRGHKRDFDPAEVLLVRTMANLASCVVRATTALETLRYQSAAEKAPAEEFDNIVLDLDDQIELLIDEFEKAGRDT